MFPDVTSGHKYMGKDHQNRHGKQGRNGDCDDGPAVHAPNRKSSAGPCLFQVRRRITGNGYMRAQCVAPPALSLAPTRFIHDADSIGIVTCKIHNVYVVGLKGPPGFHNAR